MKARTSTRKRRVRAKNGHGLRKYDGTPNPIRAWFADSGMQKTEFARRLGITVSAVSQLCADNGTWVSRRVAAMLPVVTNGKVTADDLARYYSDQ